MKTNKFYNTPLEEQETIINIDYSKKEINCYTSRYAVYNKLLAKLGEPTEKFYTSKKISGASWTIPFMDKKMANVIFSKTVVIGNM